MLNLEKLEDGGGTTSTTLLKKCDKGLTEGNF